MVIIYYIGKQKRVLHFDKHHAKKSEDGNAWLIAIPDPNGETAKVHTIPMKDISDIMEDRIYKKSLVSKNSVNSLTGF